MIKFLQDYTTTALPPEHFERGQEVSDRSADSEAYFVKLGVAGFVIDGKLVDQDYRPIAVTEAVVAVVTTDRRFAAGRGGETLGLDAPARATAGPGNAVVFGSEAAASASSVEFEQLRSDVAAAVEQYGGFERRLATLEGGDVAAKLDAINGRLAALEVGDVAEKLPAIEQRLATLEAAAKKSVRATAPGN